MKKMMVCGAFVFGLCACPGNALEKVVVRNEAGIATETYFIHKKTRTREGLYQRFSDDGKLKETATYVNDVVEGERRLFYPNGNVEIIEPYVHGKIHGKYRKFAENGQLLLEQDYQNGVLEGISLSWYPNGTLKERVVMRNNEENGPFTEWHENGKIKAEGSYFTPDDPDFFGEREHGELKLYDNHGELERIMDCHRGVCKTRWQRQTTQK